MQSILMSSRSQDKDIILPNELTGEINQSFGTRTYACVVRLTHQPKLKVFVVNGALKSASMDQCLVYVPKDFHDSVLVCFATELLALAVLTIRIVPACIAVRTCEDSSAVTILVLHASEASTSCLFGVLICHNSIISEFAVLSSFK